jgi:EAL domain-containing protein (putative c-di-GMP-specific phosphodiesterase class I)
LPLDQLKIDQSFVRDVLSDDSDASIARMVISLGKSLGFNVIAEGVETQGQCEFLMKNDCHTFQGYLFSKPIPADKFAEYCHSMVARSHVARVTGTAAVPAAPAGA